MNVIKYLLLILMAMLCMQCDCRQEELEKLKQKYTIEELNYFYEVVFYNETAPIARSLSKWDKDVKMCLIGAHLEDSIATTEIFQELNEMRLPIRFSVVSDSTTANMHMFFGTIKYLQTKFPDHFTSIKHLGYVITDKNKSLIGIQNVNDWVEKKMTMKEEIVQGLGLLSDSWHYPNSLFFQGADTYKSFSTMDKRLLQLLYEDYFKNGYTIEEFETDFSEEIYSVNSAQKIADCIRKMIYLYSI